MMYSEDRDKPQTIPLGSYVMLRTHRLMRIITSRLWYKNANKSTLQSTVLIGSPIEAQQKAGLISDNRMADSTG
jgi:hypothetical protein